MNLNRITGTNITGKDNPRGEHIGARLDQIDQRAVLSHYTFRGKWSPEDREYVGLCAEFPSLSWLAGTEVEAIAGIERLVGEILTDMAATGEVL
ncbi:hypothetical protein A5730_07470 [Mycobacterium sp. ACS4054]|nr:hypothetical protein A5730_07470 [Mycobacterium sp. ACS4054]